LTGQNSKIVCAQLGGAGWLLLLLKINNDAISMRSELRIWCISNANSCHHLESLWTNIPVYAGTLACRCIDSDPQVSFSTSSMFVLTQICFYFITFHLFLEASLNIL
jgi:hypothetical protein